MTDAVSTGAAEAAAPTAPASLVDQPLYSYSVWTMSGQVRVTSVFPWDQFIQRAKAFGFIDAQQLIVPWHAVTRIDNNGLIPQGSNVTVFQRPT